MPLAALVAHNLNVAPVEEPAPTVGGPLRDRVRTFRTVNEEGRARFTITVDGVDTIRPARIADGGTLAFTVTPAGAERLHETGRASTFLTASFIARRVSETATHALTTRQTSTDTTRDAYESDIWLLHGYID